MIGTAYLSMRAIDEIEDHPDLTPGIKRYLLQGISSALRESGPARPRCSAMACRPKTGTASWSPI